ncbi:MAG TPA: SRPBCC domain-containing protein [Amnibacterium sp.]|jgi:uncharacterized protein YndB with AHSA1/START domain|uniref:SRPBCC family protein n=1 Tax=Amnibacterium sp. TaxID=1872496 RepID=UPI002F932EF3
MTDAIVITRTVDAPRELVWSAWTTPEQFAVWFGTDQVEVPVDSVSMDVSPGGTWSVRMLLPDGGAIDWTGEYTVVEPPSHLALTMTDDPSRPPREPIDVRLEEADGGTRMTMRQSGEHLPSEQIEATTAGWNGFFDVLERILANPSR